MIGTGVRNGYFQEKGMKESIARMSRRFANTGVKGWGDQEREILDLDSGQIRHRF